MASELFHDLYKRAYRLDCPTIHTLNGLAAGLGPGPTLERVNLTDLLYDAGREFIDSMDEFARRHNPKRSRMIKYRCPACGDPYCNGAVQVPPAGYIVVGISGPKPPEESGK